MSGLLHFEDFQPGQVITLGPHAVTAEAIIAFAQEFDPQPFHLDEAAAQASVLGGLAASGWHTSAILLRLMCDACLTRSAVLGSSGMDEVKWLKPVLAGDVLSGTMEVTATRLSRSLAGTGILNFVASLADQNSTPKIETTGMFFMRTRPS